MQTAPGPDLRRKGGAPAAPWHPWVLVAGLCLVGAVVGSLAIRALFQVAPASVQDLDLSWQLSLGAALADHLRFGSQYLFTYGPLGFLHVSMVYPAVALTAIAATVNVVFYVAYPIGLLLFANLVRQTHHLGWRAGGGLLVLTAVVAFWTGIAANLGTVAELLSLVAWATCLLRPDSRRIPWLAFAAGILLAFGALFKVDLLEVALTELVILTVVTGLLPQRQLLPAGLGWLGFLLGYLAFWLGTGQRLTDLPRFWVGSWELSIGYSSAMSLASNWVPVAGLAALAVTGIGLPVLLRRWQGWRLTVQEGLILLSLPYLFVTWKDSMVRLDGFHNGRALPLIGVLLAVAWLVAVTSSSLRSRWVVGPAATACLCAAVMLGAYGPLIAPSWVISLWTPGPAVAVTPQTAPDYIPANLLAGLMGHTVNALPWDIALVIDNHLRWDPLPEPQSYSAYTPYLDRLDASQLASPQGASRLLVSLTDIDDRYLFWDPPAVWNTVISRYSCLATTGISAILERRPPQLGPSQGIASTTVPMGAWVSVPATTLRYEFADVHIGSTLEGQTIGFVLRQTAVFANLRLSNGTVVGPLRLVAATAGAGLYLSHYITTPQQLCATLSGRASSIAGIVAVQFTTAHPSQWSRSIRIDFVGAGTIGSHG